MNNPRGMTILELLLALMLFSVSAVVIFGTFWASMKMAGRVQTTSEMDRHTRVGLETLIDDLEHMVAYDFSGSLPDRMAFEGNAESLSLIRATGKGLVHVHYSMEQAGESGRQQLIRSEQPFADFLNQTPGKIQKHVVMRKIGPEGLKFTYGFVSHAPDGNLIEWRKDWFLSGLPAQIKVHMVLPASKPDNAAAWEYTVIVPTGSLGNDRDV